MDNTQKAKSERFMALFGDYKGDWKCTEADTDDSIDKEIIDVNNITDKITI